MEVEQLPIAAAIGDDPLAGMPQTSYGGRANVIGREDLIAVREEVDGCHSERGGESRAGQGATVNVIPKPGSIAAIRMTRYDPVKISR